MVLSGVMAAAAAIGIGGWMVGKGRWRAGITGALAILAHAAILDLFLETTWHQRFPWLPDLLREEHAPHLAVIAVDLAWVTVCGLPRVLRAGPERLRAALSPHGLVALTLFVGTGGLVTPFVVDGTYLYLLTNLGLGAAFMALGAANLAVFAVESDGIGSPAIGKMFADRPEDLSEVGRRLPWLGAAFVLVVSAALALLVFETIPQIPDTVSMYWQARYFAAGYLYLPPPPEPEAFHQYLVVYDETKQYAHSSPGWPFVLSLGMRAGVPWLVNPLVGAMTVPLVHRMVRDLAGLRAAQLSVLLLAASPWFLFMNASYMVHPMSLLVAVLALWAILGARRQDRLGWAALSAAALGLLFATRSFEAIVVGCFCTGWLALPGGRRRVAHLATLFGVGLLSGLPNLVYNHLVTGAWSTLPTTTGIATEYAAESNRLGFGDDIGFGWTEVDLWPGHSPLEALINAQHNAYWVQFETFGWPCGSLAMILLGMVWFKGGRPADRPWWALAGTVVFAYGLYWFSGGPDYGARYWYLVLPAVVGLTASFASRIFEQSGPAVSGGAARALGLAVLAGLVTVVPWRATDKYPRRRCMQPHVAELEREHDWSDALIFIEVERSEDYASAFLRNPLRLDRADGRPIYARSRGDPADARLRAHFPDRTAWRLEAPTACGGPYSSVRRLD